MDKLHWINTILLLGVGQSLLLIVALNYLKRGNRPANQWLSLFIGLLSLALLSRVLFSTPWYVRYILPYLFTFIANLLFGPVFFLYITRLLFPAKKITIFSIQKHFALGWLFLLTFVPQVFYFSNETYFGLMQNKNSWVSQYWWLAYRVASWYNLLYIIGCFRLITQANVSKESKTTIKYLKTVTLLIGACIAGWVLYGILITVRPGSRLFFTIFQVIWLLSTLVVYIFGYFVLARPEIFTFAQPATSDQKPEKYSSSLLEAEDVQQLKQKLEILMQAQKPYLDANITNPKLAQMLQTNPTALSRTINECYQLNFFHFINQYRVKEFIRLAIQPQYQQYTYLALAHEVGFNSKSTFNNAFKKVTQMTPREYFKKHPHRAKFDG